MLAAIVTGVIVMPVLLVARQGFGGLGDTFAQPRWMLTGGALGACDRPLDHDRGAADRDDGRRRAADRRPARGRGRDRPLRLFGFDRVALDVPRVAGHRAAGRRRCPDAQEVSARAWTALWAVYLIWGSTYLGIKVAGDTIPAFFAVSSRFLLAGALLAGWVAWRQGRGALRVTRAELASAALIGLLLPGANGASLHRRADRPDGRRLADHRVRPAARHPDAARGRRAPAAARARRRRRRLPRRCVPVPPGGRRDVVGHRRDGGLRARVGGRLVPLRAAAAARGRASSRRRSRCSPAG